MGRRGTVPLWTQSWIVQVVEEDGSLASIGLRCSLLFVCRWPLARVSFLRAPVSHRVGRKRTESQLRSKTETNTSRSCGKSQGGGGGLKGRDTRALPQSLISYLSRPTRQLWFELGTGQGWGTGVASPLVSVGGYNTGNSTASSSGNIP